MLRTLSLVEWEIRSVVSCTVAFCGATHSAVEHREEGVEAFRQQRVREDRIRHVGSQRAPLGSRPTLCRAAPRYIGLRVGLLRERRFHDFLILASSFKKKYPPPNTLVLSPTRTHPSH